ncbi:MAG TPA: SUF system NifU family Fe-S cluster assembly protein [Dehalococcoidia bacterium]|nr:SUF system NifU family Fe-S cluster assembly protein [Dehalococcoidia bacterium]
MQPRPEPELDELYRELILDHYKNPRNRKKLAHADVVAEGYNPVCGDEVEMELDFDGETLTDIGIVGRGCSISQASGSMMSDLVQGKSIAEIRRLADEFKQMMTDADAPAPEDLGDLEALQGVAKFAVRVKCATLPWHTLADGIAQHERGDGAVSREEA